MDVMRVARRFEELFGRPAAKWATAPGRVNLIGEHTDYNGGFVLPIAVPLRTRVLIAPRGDRQVHVSSTNVGAAGEVREYRLGEEAAGGDWLDYVQGVTWALRSGGHTLSGFDALIDSDLPIGGGLASSAALEVALMWALRAEFNLALDDFELARTGQRAENGFAGANVGIMDQMAASMADEETALFLDTRSLSFERVAWPEGMELVVIDSGIRHANAGGEYNVRRAECERACALLGVAQLRELGVDDLPRLAGLPEPLVRRARHVVTENARVVEAAGALRAGDAVRLGGLFGASHASMRDDYEVSISEINLLASLAEADAQVYGARLTGGGFGGCIIALTAAGAAAAAGERVVGAYTEATGRAARVMGGNLTPP